MRKVEARFDCGPARLRTGPTRRGSRGRYNSIWRRLRPNWTANGAPRCVDRGVHFPARVSRSDAGRLHVLWGTSLIQKEGPE
jgi:hypothetical protein